MKIASNFLKEFGLKFFSLKISKIFWLKRFTKDGALTSQSDRPIRAPIWYIHVIFVFENLKKNYNFRIFFKIVGLCLLGAYTGDAGAGAQTPIPHLQHISILLKTLWWIKSYAKTEIGLDLVQFGAHF